MARTDSKEYAQEQLLLNPHVFAQQIVERRARFLGIEKAAPKRAGADLGLQERRRVAEETLSEIRSEFWTAPLEQIQSRLEALNLEGLPDLAVSAARLARTAQVRPQFPQLYAERNTSNNFVDLLRQVLVLPASAAGIKERKDHILSTKRELRSAKRTVRIIAKKYPEIHELDREWLDYVASARRVSRVAVPTMYEARQWSLPERSWLSRYSHWLIYLLMMILIGLLRGLLEK